MNNHEKRVFDWAARLVRRGYNPHTAMAFAMEKVERDQRAPDKQTDSGRHDE